MLNNKHKIFFIGNGSFAAKVLNALIQNKFPLDLIITFPSRKAGRGLIPEEVPVRKIIKNTSCRSHKVSSKKDLFNRLAAEKPDLVLLSDFSWIIDCETLKIPKRGFLNIHPSLLPKHRGPTPIQSTILNSDLKTGVSIIKMDEKIDHGPIVAQKPVAISPLDNSESLEIKLANESASLVIKALPDYLSGKLKPKLQDHSLASYCAKLSKEDGKIDWTKSAKDIDRLVRATNPWPKAFTFFNEKRLIIFAGRISKNDFIPTQVQLEGKRVISWSEFLNGQRMTQEKALEKIKN